MSLNHIRCGSGEPLLLVHGLGSQWQIWTPQLEGLAAERDVIAFDLPGFGGSPPLSDRPTVARLTEAIGSFMDELGLERAHVAGFSLGGGIALELGRAGRAKTVTALAPIGFWTKPERVYERALFRATVGPGRRRPEQIARLGRNPVVRTLLGWHLSAKPWRFPPDAYEHATMNLLTSPGFDATLDAHLEYVFHDRAEISVPITVAWGTWDAVLLTWQRFRARRALPQARHVTLHGCGHVPHWDDPDAVTRVILEGSAAATPAPPARPPGPTTRSGRAARSARGTSASTSSSRP
jgi:pimeloyl-ACP methyl ester carboxylesterase